MNTNEEESDIRNHIRYQNIEARPANENDFLNYLKKMIVEYIGPVVHVSRESKAHYSPNYDHEFNILVGFKFDMDALECLVFKQVLSIEFQGKYIDFHPIPTPAFR